jgi:hypothetical protein
MFNYVGKPHQNVLMHFWAFGAEETFLFFAVPIIAFCKKELAVKIFSFLALFSMAARGITFYYFTDPSQFDWWTYMQTHLHLFGLSFGVIIALTKDSFKFNSVFLKFKVHWAALILLILVSPYLETKFDIPYLWLYKPIFSCMGFTVLLRYFLTYPDSFLSKGLTRLFNSRIYTTAILTVMVIILIMIMYPCKQNTPTWVLLKLGFYIFIVSIGVIFMHDCVILKENNEKRGDAEDSDIINIVTDKDNNDDIFNNIIVVIM